MNNKLRKELKNVPNLLSIFRILLIPLFVWALFSERGLGYDFCMTASAILLLSGITDFADGYIARSFNLVSELGKVLDPFADKLTQITVAVCLFIIDMRLSVILVVLVVKEVLMLIGGYIILKTNKKIAASKWFGKIATAVFYLCTILIIAFPKLDFGVVALLMCITSACMIYSFVMYIPVYKAQFSKSKNNSSERKG